MSTGSVPISQKEYLKKYLSGSNGEKRKKKKQKIISSSTFKRSQIIDDDIDLKNMRALNDDDEVDIFQLDEDAPQIAGIIDERPAEIRAQEYYNDNKRWKVFAAGDDGDGIKVIDQQKKDNLLGTSENIQNVSTLKTSKENSKTKPKSGDLSMSVGNKKLISNYGAESDSDQSLPRRSTKHESRSRQSDNDSDLSPPRKLDLKISSKKNIKESYSDKRKYSSVKSGSDSGQSPQRISKLDYKRDSKNISSSKTYNRRSRKDTSSDNDSDLSPPRKSSNVMKNSRRNESDSDLSPQRKTKMETYPINRSKFSKISRNDKTSLRRDQSDSVLSPSRKTYKRDKSIRDEKYYSSTQKNTRSSSGSPPRNHKKYSHRKEYYDKNSSSPSRKSKHKDSRVEQLNKSDSDLSPPRNSSHSKHSEYSTNKRKSEFDSLNLKNSSNSSDITKRNKMEKTLDGKRAGLQNAQNLKKELTDFKNREDQLFSKMNASVSGEGAAPVMRDRKTGKIRDLDEEKVIDKEKATKNDALKEKYSRWGKGLKQVEDAEQRVADAMKVMSKPLARYADDEDLDNFLKAQDREGDPMLDYIKRKQSEAIALTEQKPKYQGSFTPNRFGIRPGHRWDGVDRSNGYEKKWFTQQNARKARDEEAYKWSTSDM